MISLAFIITRKSSSWDSSLLYLSWNTVLKYIPFNYHLLQDKAQPLLSAVPPRVYQLVTFPRAHYSSTRRIVYLRMHPSNHSFSARQVAEMDANRSVAQSLNFGWVYQLDATCSIVQFFNASHKEAGRPSIHPLSSHTSAKVVALVTKPLSDNF